MQRPPPFVVFAALSLGLHAAALGGAARDKKAPPEPEFESTGGALVGETLDVEPTPLEEVEPSPGTPSDGKGEPATEAPAPPAPGAGPRSIAAAGSSAAAPASSASLFGAVGVRYAVDLATTFTRAFPQAGSADPVWGTVPLGSAGAADVTLVLDESGHLVSHTIDGSPSPALRRGIERALVMLQARAFTAKAAVTRLRITARVSTNDVHDGWHGDVFALSGGSFAGATGTAFFALPGSPGRRIDLELRMLR